MVDRVFIIKSTEEGGDDTIISLDAVIQETHTSSARVTSNPIELGAEINDHVIIEPTKLRIRGAITDTPLGFAALSTIVDNVTNLFGSSTEENLTRSQQGYKQIVQIRNDRLPIEVQTGLVKYSNMVITNIEVSQDKDTSKIAIMDISLQELIIVESEITQLDPANLDEETKEKAEEEVDEGKVETESVTGTENTSYLKQVSDFVGGLF